MKPVEETFIILEIYEDKEYTMEDALKRIAEDMHLNPEDGFIEAEEREDGLFQVTNTAFYLRRAS